MSAGPPLRRSLRPLSDTDRPLALPHLETGDGPFRFLGHETTLVDELTLPLWNDCAGARELGSWPEAERVVIAGWYAAGLLVAVPPARTRGRGSFLVVSPHPDDAQLAVGGLLAAGGGHVVDVFTEETWTRRAYYTERPELTASLLLAEERVACRVLGAELTLLRHVDGEARPAWKESFFLDDPARSRPQDVEPDLFAALVADLGAALPPAGDVLAPLGVGGHVDHVLSREAVLDLVAGGALDPARLVFYEDMPYSVFGDAGAAATALSARRDVGPLRSVLVPSRAADVKREALWAYRLQTTEGMTTRVMRYGAKLVPDQPFAERLWVTPERTTPLFSATTE
ncbi:PIG-L family deacetylase [Plantactinospora sp. CA-290183]|uniref:PIG-L family deacetylase n=1 Tax=Plantactinospora sp. CA-290183 TaxID=3240006 RepID=UPI003D94ED30